MQIQCVMFNNKVLIHLNYQMKALTAVFHPNYPNLGHDIVIFNGDVLGHACACERIPMEIGWIAL